MDTPSSFSDPNPGETGLGRGHALDLAGLLPGAIIVLSGYFFFESKLNQSKPRISVNLNQP
jgi:hypothetical protein